MQTKVFELAPEHGYKSYRQLAKAMHISAAQVWRVQHGQRTINGMFIAGALRAFPGKSFEELFTVARERETEQVA